MGGAPGHMDHPFDLGWVNTGSDLLSFFNKAKAYIEEARGGSVKIDGVNVSFKVVETPNGHEFAVDRGSMKEIDISGITMARFQERFPPGHGMRKFVAQLLTILNAAIGDVEPELKALGMWKDPTLFLNTEYVEGKTNVTQYDENFLAIHGLNQFYERTAKAGPSKGNVRPGASRPTIWDEKKQKEVPIKDPSREVSYDQTVMGRLIEKLRPYGKEYGFQIYGDVPTEAMADVDFTGALSEPLSIKISEDRTIKKSLGEWLQESRNPGYRAMKVRVIDDNGNVKTMTWHPLHKDLYKILSSGKQSLVETVDERDAADAIYGTVFMHAARMLGNEILRALTSPMGDVINHEGVVLRNKEVFGTPKPVKITGEFIIGGTASDFQKASGAPVSMKEDLDIEIEDEDEDPVVDLDFEDEPKQGETIAIVPGAFKPPHQGHLDMVIKYLTGEGLNVPKADKVKVIISKPTLKGRYLPDGTEVGTAESLALWEQLIGGMPGVDVEVSQQHASPINAGYELVGENTQFPAGTNIILGASTKGGDYKRWSGASKYVSHTLNLYDPELSAIEPTTHMPGYIEMLTAPENKELFGNLPSKLKGLSPNDYHASDFRYMIHAAKTNPVAKKLLESFVGEGNINALLSTFGIPTGIEEMSAMGAGAVAVGSGPFPGKRDKKNKKKKKQKENIDLSLVDDVIRLIMERGISQ